nr:immunoglobulin heavy chain junction region [Mus musculus]
CARDYGSSPTFYFDYW